MVVDKPSGLLVIPTPKNEANTLTNILNEGLKQGHAPYRAHPCHRLDRDTSGLVIYAKGKATQKKMMDEFKAQRVKKAYVAFVQGRLARPHGEIRTPIEGKTAVTRYRLAEQRPAWSVIEVFPLTGRTNQIRVHFRQIGNPILGDTRFVFRRHFTVKAKRLCLHATRLEFTHPITGEEITVESELPEKMRDMMKGAFDVRRQDLERL